MDYSTPIEAAQNDGLKDIIEGVLAVNNVRCLNDAEDRDAVRDDLYDALRRLHGTTALRRVYGKGRFFSIAVLYRSDLAELGYDTSRVDDATMMRLAARMTDAYCANVFSIDLPIIADNLCIPKREQLSPPAAGVEGCAAPAAEEGWPLSCSFHRQQEGITAPAFAMHRIAIIHRRHGHRSARPRPAVKP